MKRSFKVATVFTGAVACAVALAPAAGAATTTPKITPYIEGGTCTANPTHSLVLAYSPKENHPTPACFAGKGIWHLPNKPRFASYCTVNYSGYLWIGGQKRNFTQGAHNLFNAAVSAVSITQSHNRNATCSW